VFKITPATRPPLHIRKHHSSPTFPKVLIQIHRNVGAVAELFDISCLFGTSSFTTIQDEAFNMWHKAPSSVTAQEAIKLLGRNQFILGQHYFVPNPKPAAGSPAISPKWDFTSAADKGNANAFVIGAKVGDLPAPTGKTDVDWLQVKNVEGALADTIYRVYTKGGQPPSSVSPVRFYGFTSPLM
jgi:hypothetical protein